MPNWNEDWPDSANLRDRRAAFVEREMAKLQKPIDPLSEDFQQRMRDGLASANAYCLARVPVGASWIQRNAILIELNPDYADMSRQRVLADAGMFADALVVPVGASWTAGDDVAAE